jgi:hypothetical protein
MDRSGTQQQPTRFRLLTFSKKNYLVPGRSSLYAEISTLHAFNAETANPPRPCTDPYRRTIPETP